MTVPSSEISMCGVVPRTPMVATGVSIFMSPVFAILPATKVNVPLDQLNNVELDFPFGSYTNSFNAMRALLDRLNEVPSVKLIPDPAIGAGLDHVAAVDEITNLRLTGLTGDICLNDHRLRMFNCDRTRGRYNFPDGF